jgi:hypothetical protein
MVVQIANGQKNRAELPHRDASFAGYPYKWGNLDRLKPTAAVVNIHLPGRVGTISDKSRHGETLAELARQ